MNLNQFLSLLAESKIMFGHFSARTNYTSSELKDFLNEKGKDKNFPLLQITFEASTCERKTALLEISHQDYELEKFSFTRLFPEAKDFTSFRLDFLLKNEFAQYHKFGKILKIYFYYPYTTTGIDYISYVTAAVEN